MKTSTNLTNEKDKIPNSSKYHIEIKQSRKGKWYIGSIKINADNKDEFKNLLDEVVGMALNKLNFINKQMKKF